MMTQSGRGFPRKAFLTALAVMAACLWPAFEASATFITPKKVDIYGQQRTATLTILNRGSKAMSYTFGWQRRALTSEGETLVLKSGQTSPGYRPADEFIQFSPRRIVLQPGQKQKVRFLIQRPPGLANGEYHSHFLVMPEPLNESAEPEQSQRGLAGVLQVRTHSAIPVFIRQGETDVSVKIREASLSRKGDLTMLHYILDNASTRTIYARVDLECYASVSDKTAHSVTTARIYAEAKTLTRESAVPADFDASRCGALKMRLVGTDDPRYKNQDLDIADVRK